VLGLFGAGAVPVWAQQAPPLPAARPATAATGGQAPSTVCGLPIPPPARLPPTGSGPVVYLVVPCFQKQGGSSMIDPQTYIYYIEMSHHVSRPSENAWVPYNDSTEQTIIGDFKRLWATNFLDDLSIESIDYPFSNGVIGKIIVYDMEERQRVKIVDYVGSKKVEQSKIDDELKKKGMQIRLDSFIDPGLVRRVAGVVRDMYAEKGYQYAEVKPEIKSVTGGTKTVNLTFHITEGPQVKIEKVDFQGNKALSDYQLGRKMKENKGPSHWPVLRWFAGPGTYKEGKFEDDAEKVVEYYREKGYVKAQVGQPELRILEDSSDGHKRWVQVEVPVTEGSRYKIGTINFSGNTVVKSEGLRPLFKVQEGEWFNEKKIRKGFDKARELYGTGGYFEFTGVPEYQFPDDPKPADGAEAPPPSPAPASPTPATAAQGGDGSQGPPKPTATLTTGKPVPAPAVTGKAPAWWRHIVPFVDHSDPRKAPRVNMTMRLEEGKQYYVNRITFSGNTTTRDNVIRREIRLFEGGVFNTEALKYSVRRINQLGYFKNLENEAVDVQKTPGADNKVDIKLKVEEQNRNQITFGAGVSQYEGFFGQLAFQTSNFLGRGETFSVSAQQGNRAKNYQIGFTEPFLFDRPITAGIDVFDTEIQYIGAFTQASKGMNTVWGFPVGPFARLFANYSYQAVRVKDLNPLYTQAAQLGNNPFLADSLLLKESGERRISKIGPSFVYNTVDSPIFPTTGKRLTLGFDVAGLGGNSQFYSTTVEGVTYLQQTRRLSLGLRGQFQYIRPYGSTTDLPIFEKLFLGGEYSIRGYDIRSIGPRDLNTNLVIGGNKSLLFNAEYLINIAGPVRLVLFYDAGQVRDVGDGFMWKEPVQQLVHVGGLSAADQLTSLYYVNGAFKSDLPTRIETTGMTSAFKTSTGAEIRFFMPVLNVPFRLIFAMNPQRGGVLDNNLLPEKRFKFRFAVGTTF
jgi:outer membrane protein assembly factor BamA